MKEITITIKPKLKWNTHGNDGYWEGSNFVIWISENMKYYTLKHSNKIIGYFNSLKHAKAVAELIYQG